MTPKSESSHFFSSLGQLSQKLLQSDSYDQIVSLAREEVAATLGYNNIWLYLHEDTDSSQCRLLSISGEMHKVANKKVSLLEMNSDPFLKEIFAAKGLVYVEDARSDPRTNKEIVAEIGNRTIINCPVMLYNQTLGFFGAGSFHDEGVRPLGDMAKEYFIAMTNILAVAIDRLRLIEISSIDHLTGLHNRRSLLERGNITLMQAQRHKRIMGLIYIDMNNFKPVNDQHGHAVGDEILKSFANCLRENVRLSDIVARVGGDEFVIILTELNCINEINQIADHIRAHCVSPSDMAHLSLEYSYSMGMASYPDDGETIEALLNIADQRMYHDKQRIKQAK